MRRADDMPLYGLLTRVGKCKYEVIIKFVKSKRVLHKEQLPLPTRAAVQQFFAREYPSLTWGEPKFRKPRIKIVRSKPPKKKVTRKGKSPKPRKRKKERKKAQ
jgi:hypothetical protein